MQLQEAAVRVVQAVRAVAAAEVEVEEVQELQAKVMLDQVTQTTTVEAAVVLVVQEPRRAQVTVVRVAVVRAFQTQFQGLLSTTASVAQAPTPNLQQDARVAQVAPMAPARLEAVRPAQAVVVTSMVPINHALAALLASLLFRG